MKMSALARRVGWTAALLGWSAFAFWAFSLSYSTSYFEYSLASRLPPFLAAFVGAVAIPVSVWYQLQRVGRSRHSMVRAWVMHVCTSIAAVAPLAAIAAVLSRIRGPMHLSGDDAMGVGLNFIFLTATALFSVLFLTVVLVLKHRRASRVV